MIVFSKNEVEILLNNHIAPAIAPIENYQVHNAVSANVEAPVLDEYWKEQEYWKEYWNEQEIASSILPCLKRSFPQPPHESRV